MSTPNANNNRPPRSRSRSKRSTTNLSNLRLAPLSQKYTSNNVPSTTGSEYQDEQRPKTPSDEAYARQHSSYLQGKSAPTTPGILSRSSTRRSFSGGLSRRDDKMYDDDEEEDKEYTYNNSPAAFRASLKADGDLHRSQSDGTFLTSGATTPGTRQGHRRHLSGHGMSASKKHPVHARSKTGTSTPRALEHDDSWLMHTGSRTSAILQESKGQSWLLARDPPPPSSDDDNDEENYEEMAVLSASTAKLEKIASRGSQGEPASAERRSRWGSRYGSRSQSTRTSRYGSPVGTRTPRPARDASGYFDDYSTSYNSAMTEMQQRAFVETPYPREFTEDQAEVDRLSNTNSFGLGSVVDRLMNLRVFGAAGGDGAETTDDESGRDHGDDTETEGEAKDRMAREQLRRKQEKERLAALLPAPTADANGDGQVGTWQDAAWLLSVASKALF